MTEQLHTESPSDAIARWQEWQASTCGESTIRQRADILERCREHVAARSGRPLDDVDPRDLTAEDVAAYLARPGGRPLAANSKAAYFRALSCWLGWLHRSGRIPTDPTLDIRAPRGRTGMPNPLTPAEVERAFDGADQALRAMMALALFAGLRAHEVAEFRGEQIRGGRWLVVNGKGDRDARLPVAPQLADIAETMPDIGYWFPSPTREHLCADWVTARVGSRFREVQISRGSIHRFRHTFGTLTHRRHRDLLVTRRLLRHASVATTQIYAGIEDGDMVDALAGLPKLTG